MVRRNLKCTFLNEPLFFKGAYSDVFFMDFALKTLSKSGILEWVDFDYWTKIYLSTYFFPFLFHTVQKNR